MMTAANTQSGKPAAAKAAWEPEIIAFCCNYCAYAAAGLCCPLSNS